MRPMGQSKEQPTSVKMDKAVCEHLLLAAVHAHVAKHGIKATREVFLQKLAPIDFASKRDSSGTRWADMIEDDSDG